jgi:hypothetical protein
MLPDGVMDSLSLSRGNGLQFPLSFDLCLSDPLAFFVCDPGSLAWPLLLARLG